MSLKANIKNHAFDEYTLFDKLDGTHPWMQTVQDGYVPYRVRELRTGKVGYFNYALAKEMGLISATHDSKMTEVLEQKLLETFSLQIINEYDELNKKRINPDSIKPNKYMASRYLQLQHANKQGKTSGDGRGIWNGVIENRGRIWDVSSRGTGVTCLAPGAVQANRPLKTGGGDFGYGCGQAELDELYGAAILAEVFHLQGIATERVLCVIDLGKGYGIGVRAAPNLLRPAHIFRYLKQNRYQDLKASMDYLLDRQVSNRQWNPQLFQNAKNNTKYDLIASEISKSFANFAAVLDIDYIFAWLDWDGDNVLADAGIIDYGSVRQFGIRHDQYRYDDVQRFSTNLNEQRRKARLLVQVFTQISDYLKTKEKKPLKTFAKHSVVQAFDQQFELHRSHRLLYRMGFNQVQRENILKHKEQFKKFNEEFSYFEKAKISGKKSKVADGVNHPALFNMRAILKELPDYYMKFGFETDMGDQQFYQTILSSFAKQRDTRMREKHVKHIRHFQSLYKKMLIFAAGKQKPKAILSGFQQRAKNLNREDRITGNALIQIVNELMAQIKKGLNHQQVQSMIDQLVFSYVGAPEVNVSRFLEAKPRRISNPDLYNKFMNLVAEHSEDI